MKISLNWLRDFVTWDCSDEELAHLLTMNGLNVEGLERFELAFPGVVVAKVTRREQHPNADKLSLCRVFDGEQEVDVVCGAPNVRAGLTVLFARVGAVLPGDFRIKESKIRGETSMGMICSATELGLGGDASGIMELGDELEAGTPADEIYGCRDTVFDIEVTPNRPDWLSHLGVAREVAAIAGCLLQVPETWSPSLSTPDTLDFHVDIQDFAACPRYTAHVARGVVVGPSPRWLQNRLLAVGARPINNVVDITNYVLFETGQPLHAFDLSRISGGRLKVRYAAAGEKIRTLDAVERTLDPTDLVIADTAGPVALAGVMGGTGSQVGAECTELLLESAYFEPGLIRRGARRHQLHSESSYRFERGADWDAVETGARRALWLLQSICGAHIDSGLIDRQNPDSKDPEPIALRTAQVNRILGTALPVPQIIKHLQAIGLKAKPLGQASDRDVSAKLMVTVPSFRRDLFEEVDLIEEVARMHGFEKIGAEGRVRGAARVDRNPRAETIQTLRLFLADLGYQEIVTSSFMDRRAVDQLGIAPDDVRAELLPIDNPCHGGETLLRTTLLPSLLDAARHNVNADAELPLRLFQINKAFLPAGAKRHNPLHADEMLLPEETHALQIAVVGRSDEYNGLPGDLMEIRGALEAISGICRLDLELDPGTTEPFIQPGLGWRVRDRQGRIVGHAGQLSRRTQRAVDVDASVAFCELDLRNLDLAPKPVQYAPFSRYPAVKRDLSLVAGANCTYGDVKAVIEEAAGALLDRCELFDVFRGPSLAGGTALGIRLQFRSPKGSLKGKAVDTAIAKITAALEQRLGVRLRT